ncbi:MAG: IPT/TIG domain-containing protein [Mycobacteriales bacterium]
MSRASFLTRWSVCAAVACVVAALLPVLPIRAAHAAAAPTGSITLHVDSARSVNSGPGFVHQGDAVTTYKWLINVDDTGDPGTLRNQGIDKCLPATAPGGSTDPNYADSCQWPSVRNTSGTAPIVAQGDQNDLSDSKALDDLPAGKYLISVTADGFKIDGKHFTVAGGQTTAVTVDMNPTPLPLTTLRIEVFNDNAPVDATYEVDAERGLQGFTAHLTDVLGTVSTDYYGNALCTKYMHQVGTRLYTDAQRPNAPIAFDANNKPVVDPASTGVCVSDRTGLVVIPNMGPNRYAATITPPAPAAGQTWQWVQTTTLEGGHDHDIWSQEGATGFDTEQVKGAELVPSVQFGFVKTQAMATPKPGVKTGEVKGVAIAGLPYIGGQNGQVVPETGFAGAKSGGPISRPWVALSNLDQGDAQVYVGRGATNGSFDITNVPAGSYQLSIWDDDQDYILWSFNIGVTGGQVTDVGNKMIVGWFTHVHGTVFVDSNGNGRQDPGERAVPSFTLTVRERDNSLMDQATNTTITGDNGSYDLRETYPLGKWLVLEAFNTRYKTTGITYKGENETKATTKLGSLVDVNFLPIIGLGGEIDWGVQPYDPGTNGGIVGTVTYDTTRNELDAADSVTEAYQPGINGVPVHLYVPVPCTAATLPENCHGGYQTEPAQIDDPNNPGTLIANPVAGALVKGPEAQDSYTSETWQPPRGCTARQYNGQPLTDQQALPPFGTTANALCVEAPMMGVAVGPSDSTPGAASQTVNGNYGFATSKINLFPQGDARNPAPDHQLPLYADLAANGYPEEDLPAADYIVSVDIPKDPVDGKPMYKVTREEDVNIFQGDSYLPQQNYPPATPAVANDAPQGDQPTPTQPISQQAGIISACAGPEHVVHVTDPAFVAGGGSPFEGQAKPLCTDKLVTVRTGQATAPNFNLYTDVPIPTHFWGLTLNDLGLTLDKRSVNYGEAQGIPYVPVGLYDWAGRLVDTAHTDFNGLYEALEPSTDTYNCPVPAGPCPNMYRFVGNDPGQPGALNADYNPRFRTIATNFQAWPGLYTVTDEAPTQVASTALAPDTTVANPTVCDLGPDAPQVLAVDRPYVRKGTATDNRQVTVTGFGFGADTGTLALNGTTVTPTSWADKKIVFTVPATLASGPAALSITRASGLSSVNGLDIQVLDAVSASTPGTSPTNPRLAEVGPGKAYSTIQAALEAARPTSGSRYWLVVVWPNAQTTDNPQGEYTENLIVHHQVHIQGVGPGGFDADGVFTPGSIIDGSGFNADSAGGTAWVALLGSLQYSGNPAVPDAAVVTVLDDPRGTAVPTTYPLTFDGFTVTGGAQSDLPVNINEINGGITTPYGASGALVTQGGGVYVHSNVRNLQLTDNIIRGNGGSYGGGVRVGTPYVGDNRNYNLLLARNQIRDNGGTNLAGGVGLFTGSDGYRVTGNALCGNFSAEYGGALSAFGYQAHTSNGPKGGSITKNRIWFNASYDEGGGVMLAGELPSDPTRLSEGTGPVTVDANVIQTNLANDDGGAIRLLQTSGSHISRSNPETIAITNNTIANNVSAHEGGGIALDDAAFVNIVNNTVAKNLTTATAVTSDGNAAPAGLSTAANSAPLQSRLRSSAFSGSSTLASTVFSKPTLLNDVFWDNRAGSFSGGWVTGIGGTLPDGTANDVNNWDMGVVDVPGALLTPTHTVLQDGTGVLADTSNSSVDPGFKANYDVTVNVLAARTYPAFRQAVIVAQLLPPTLMGDYHLGATTSSAYALGAASTLVSWGIGSSAWTYTVSAPTPDIDGDPRPSVVGTVRRYDAGADQLSP